jgi:hypothetical protein
MNMIAYDSVNSTFTDLNLSKSSLDTYTRRFLQYFIPIMTSINTPLSLANFFVFLNTGYLKSPSVLIYFNLVIVDLVNSALGIMISVRLWNNSESRSVMFWGKGGLALAESYLTLFTFDANIVLVSGLCLIRVLWTEMYAVRVLRKLKLVSWVVVGLAYLYGVFCCFLWHLESQKKSFKPRLLVPSHAVGANDIANCCIIFSALYMSIYTQAWIWKNKSKVYSPIILGALRSSLLITMNVAISNSFFVAMVCVREINKVPWNNKFTCPGDESREDEGQKHDTFIDLLLCEELSLVIAFMTLQCTMNSFILLFQRRTRKYLRMFATYIWRLSEVCCCNDSDYEYL